MSRPAGAIHPLEELSGCPDPAKVTTPEGRQAIRTVTAALRAILPAGSWPMPHQIVGLAYCELADDRVLIADAPGLGKTFQTICRIGLRKHYPAIIVTTASTIYKPWKEEIEQLLPGVPVLILGRKSSTIPTGFKGVVIVSWGLLEHHGPALAALRARLLVVDEVQNGTSEGTEDKPVLRTLAWTELAAGIPHLLELSGTPIRNEGRELWFLLNVLNAKAWPSDAQFASVDKDVDHIADPRLRRRILQYMLRRRKGDVLLDLPAKDIQEMPVALSPATLAPYREIEQQYEKWLLRTMTIRMTEQLKGRTDPALAAKVAVRVEASMRAENLSKVTHLRKMIGLLKGPRAVAWIGKMHAANEAVVVFAHHKEVIAYLERELRAKRIGYTTLIGATNKLARKQAIDDFQSGKVTVFLASQAAREGITLIKARYMLFVERFWTPAAEGQAADRIHRIKQKRQVTVLKMVVKGTIDTRMQEILDKKASIVERVIGVMPE